MNPSSQRTIGSTGVSVSALGFGTAPLAGLYEAVDEDQAVRALTRAFELGVGYADTAPLYGSGAAEDRLGRALALASTPPVVSTKIGYGLRDAAEPDTFFVGSPQREAFPDWSAAGVHASFEGSLQRLGVDRVDILLLHDPTSAHLDEALGVGLGLARRWQAEGTVRAVGVGVNSASDALAVLARAELDCVLMAGRISLLDQTAALELLPVCARRETAILAAGVFNSGLLADPDGSPRFDYAPAPKVLVERALKLREACSTFGVPLAAAALQYPFRARSVVSVIAGMRSSAEVDQNVELLARDIPDELWHALAEAGLVP